MSNMSYCMFENTLGDLEQCVEAMEEACSLDDLHLSKYEMNCYLEMHRTCLRFIKRFNEFDDGTLSC